MISGGVVVGRNSVEPHIERSEAKRSEHLPVVRHTIRRCSLRSRLLRRQTGLNGVSPHHDAFWTNLSLLDFSLSHPETTFENRLKKQKAADLDVSDTTQPFRARLSRTELPLSTQVLLRFFRDRQH